MGNSKPNFLHVASTAPHVIEWLFSYTPPEFVIKKFSSQNFVHSFFHVVAFRWALYIKFIFIGYNSVNFMLHIFSPVVPHLASTFQMNQVFHYRICNRVHTCLILSSCCVRSIVYLILHYGNMSLDINRQSYFTISSFILKK